MVSTENLVVYCTTAAVVTVCVQIIFLPFLFSEIDTIRGEFDIGIRDAMDLFNGTYQTLGVIRPSGSMRRERESANQVIDNETASEPSGRPKADGTPIRKVHPTLVPAFKATVKGGTRTVGRQLPVTEDSGEDDYEELGDYEQLPISNQPSPPSPHIPPPPKREVPKVKIVNNLPICPIEANRCPHGPPGPQGSKGTPGLNGIDGNDGGAGVDAMDELTPTFTMFCTSCPPGPDGKQGQNGPTGISGLVGAQGIPGPNGKNGQPGAPGPYGAPGNQGQMGNRGPPGAHGIEGIVPIPTKGPKGAAGKEGPTGQPGEDGTINTTPGEEGIQGFPGLVGKTGEPGVNGNRGETGNPGLAGESEECKCEDMMKNVQDITENTAFVVQDDEVEQRVAYRGTEIRRAQPKSFAISRERAEQLQLATQVDSELSRFAALPNDQKQNEKLPEISESVDKEPISVPTGPIVSPTALKTASYVASIPNVSGDSRKKPQNIQTSNNSEKKKSEGKSKRKRIVRVKRVNRAKLPFAYGKNPNFALNNDKPFLIEKEIARESEKKIIERETSELDKPKKLKRVELRPSRELAKQQRENSNILENIAKSLGIIDDPPTQKNNHALRRVNIP